MSKVKINEALEKLGPIQSDRMITALHKGEPYKIQINGKLYIGVYLEDLDEYKTVCKYNYFSLVRKV